MITAFGEVLIDFIAAEEGDLENVKIFEKHPGGAPANVAVGVSRLGIPSFLVSKVGDDPFGRFLIRRLKEEGVNTEGVLIDNEKHTGVVFVQLKGAKPSFILYDEVAYFNIKLSEVPWEILESSKIVHFGSVLLAREPSRGTMIKVIETLKEKSLVSFDVNIRKDLWRSEEELVETLKRVLSNVDILKLSDEEFNLLKEYGLEPRGKLITAITYGAEGCRIESDEASIFVPAYKVSPVDTTGAGDAFVSALLVGLLALDKQKLEESDMFLLGKFANLVAGLSTQKRGAWSVPRREELEKYEEGRKIFSLITL
ncbi:carbohydrate kinase [Pyrococcus furiosus DSM 3638]|uniref:Carbohydrate kinase n=3 Tax=Pyrococcus furiosus TaxID=2261 RepID=A0A5C0XQD2_PYRFU|nr:MULTISPECIES: carbohydrate kinase [Pyrococcus]AAL81582.1 sugar kinase [Pyrococcus furiosus DSM 3638]AFN04241.1 sugar kinase [Pyrococcus furiosus COM1]MDK2869495.1 fructokinase [Pyrococcus sp.]QEK79087.1 carbohydrate kinase [Pyrococcus furiosus DSM 3638]